MVELIFTTVIAIADRPTAPPALAAAQVLSTLLDLEQIILSPTIASQSPDLPHESLILIPEAHITTYLAPLRLQGYSGAVVVLSSQSFPSLKQRYPILRAQQGSHEAWGPPWEILTLFDVLQRLVPLEPANLEDLQSNLRMIAEQHDRQLETVLFPCLNQLQQASQDFQEIITTFDATFSELLAQTPEARHQSIILDGSQKTLQSHFRQIIETIQRSQHCTDEQINNLKAILEKWHHAVRLTGEGL